VFEDQSTAVQGWQQRPADCSHTHFISHELATLELRSSCISGQQLLR